ncbi:MAG TPA: radical SAM protein [Nitrospiria bacterium]|nr:radical SAM protein [Nitrospiria bacterium]
MKINEIYKSIQGESTYVGQPCLFIRTTGCNLRCEWCDTPHAFYEGLEMTLEAILSRVETSACRLVELTGGEPLLQKEAPLLVTRLLDGGYTVLIETSGSLDIRAVDPRAIVIMDIKCPASGMSGAMRWDNIQALRSLDQVKFVIKDRADYDWALEILDQYPVLSQRVVLFSPVFGALDPRQLADWILEDGRPVRLQLQIHKYIWHPEARGV